MKLHNLDSAKRSYIILLLGLLLSACNMPQKVAQMQTLQATSTDVLSQSTASKPSFPTMTPTRIANPTMVPTTMSRTVNSVQPTACSIRTDWTIYIVVAGDTLGSLAQRTGTTVNALIEANCLTNANLISVGQRLLIPPNSLDVPNFGPPTPNGVRVGGQLTVSPVIGDESGWLVLQAGSTVTIAWPRAEQMGAVEVNFTLSGPGTGITPIDIGTDRNTADGVSIQWLVPQTGAQGYLEATAGTLGGRVLVDQTETPLKIIANRLDSGAVQIISFTVSPNPVQRGGTITLSWTTSGASSAQITRYSERGDPIDETWAKNISLNGSMSYTLSSQEYFNHISFVLSLNLGQSNNVVQRADIELTCPFETIWFGCPMTHQTSTIIYQPFENGNMIGRRDARKVYVLFNDGSWEQYADTWEGESIYPLMPENGSIPCGSSFRPYGSLGKVWYTLNPTMPSRLGCGTSTQIEYSTAWEEHRGWKADTTPIVINVFRWVDGRLLVLDPTTPWALP